MKLIECKNVSKSFGEKVALDNVSIDIPKGKIFGLLGPNGAGKTTTLRCIATLLNPTEGTVLVDGHDTVKEADKVRAKIGFLTNDIKLDPQFTVDYLFDFFGKLHKVDADVLAQRKKEYFVKKRKCFSIKQPLR